MADSESEAKSVSDEELEFHDADAGATPPSSSQPTPSPTPTPTQQTGEVDIAGGIIAIETAMDMMNKNMFDEAIKMLKPRADTCMYHSMAFSSVMFLKAGFSMDAETIESTTGELNKTIALCSAHRRDVGIVSSLSHWIFGNSSRMDNFSALELHAEIYYAEANLLLSFLTFIQDESLMSFVKGGFRIRSCYSLYKHMYEWLKTCEAEGISLEANFTSGVRMGMGSFNLFLSIIPGRILKVLEFVGFSGNRELGMTELEKGATSETFRAPICTALLLFYHTMLTVTLGVGEVDPDYAEALLNPHLEKYPKSVQFLYFKGRISLLHGDIDKAIVCYNEAINVQAQWKQVHHLCWWELMWCYCAKLDWETAATYSDMLFKQSKWSKATFLYITACCQIMPGEDGQVSVDRDEVKTIMGGIPAHKQTIAGKNLPVEKFAILKSERFIKGSRLPLAIPEMLYAYNYFVILSKNAPLLKRFLRLTWTELMVLEQTKGTNLFYADDFCVITMLQGVIFKGMNRNDEAIQCFKTVLERGNEVERDTYAVASAGVELGLLYIELEKLEEAQAALESAKTNYKGYVLENRIHFRIHSALFRIAKLKSAKSSS